MSALDDDIARIAALRGRNAAELIQKAHTPPTLQRAMVESILKPGGAQDRVQEFRWFDMLPPKSRAFIREAGVVLNAAAWAWNLHESGYQEDELIKAVQYLLTTTGDGR